MYYYLIDKNWNIIEVDTSMWRIKELLEKWDPKEKTKDEMRIIESENWITNVTERGEIYER